MAIEHLVCMKLSKALPEQELQALYRECEAHFDKIPGVVSASMGANFYAVSSQFTHALAIRFASRKAFEEFMTHPQHIAASGRLQPLFSDFLILDYETERA